MQLLAFVVLALTSSTVRAIQIIEKYPHSEESDAETDSIECTRDTWTDVNKARHLAKCRPRERLITLRPDPGYDLYPSMILVNRCHGACHHTLECLPIKTKKKEVIVYKTKIDYYKQQGFTCDVVYVEEHTECRCGCKVMKRHCKENQVYNEQNCSCECKDEKAMRDCNNQENMMWDKRECKCSCTKEVEECSTGLEWVPSLCRCAKVMPYWMENSMNYT
ncbi:uncharacterized protein LOC116430150 [Nomia melanderi]|uniref:uncharacterized protein LOC116430150 n=1 Tax=Nomia melanderi TaxID=2448451 RepID=UPI0013041C87|nr:balbiani ring protein 3-like [Nomia melanderi]